MFSKEYLTQLSAKTGFRPDSLQKQMALLDILREVNRHPLLAKQFALKGGTAINLFVFQLPRLSLDIDLNYIGSIGREKMLTDRPTLEREMKKLIQSRAISVENAPADEHAGAKWRLRAPSAFGGNFTLEIDLNYIMRIPICGVGTQKPYPIDEDYVFETNIVSAEELFAGKIKALLDRSAARDLFDVFSLSNQLNKLDTAKLKKVLLLIGITSNDDWRKKSFHTVEMIGQKTIDQDLVPLLRSDEKLDLKNMKQKVMKLVADLMKYDNNEQRFLNRFLDDGIYEPELLFEDAKLAERLKNHPAILWKLQHHRKHFRLDKQ